MIELANALEETNYLDFNHPVFDNYLLDIPSGVSSKLKAVALYHKIRDGFIYDPYHLDLRGDAMKASRIVLKKRAWCVEKSTLMAAMARKLGIPSRLGYAIVTNHIGVDKLIHHLRKEEIVFHGYGSVYLEGKWVKCTPAFDKRVCRISKVDPLDWNGEDDSMFQEYSNGQRFMEYKHFYGEFEDVPIELMHKEMKTHYPHLFEQNIETKEFSFHY
jgi:transglutaminase-like putative cysteine protease